MFFFLFTFYFLVIVTAQSVAFWGPIVDHEKVYCRWPICWRTLDNMSQFSMRCCSTLTSIHFHRITNPSQLFRVPENLQLSIWDQLYGRRVFQIIHHHQWWFTILSCFLPGFFLTSEWWSLGVDAQWEVFHPGFTASSEPEVWWWVERGVLAHSAKFKLSKYWCLTWTTVRASLGVVMVTWRWQPLAWLTHLLKDEMSTLGMAHKWTLRQEEGQGIVEPAVFALRYLQGLKNFH